METITVISPTLDENIQERINNSLIWEVAFHEDEITDEIYHKHPIWYIYSIKFDGLRPIQVTKRNIFNK